MKEKEGCETEGFLWGRGERKNTHTPLIPFPPSSQTISHDEGKRGMRNRAVLSGRGERENAGGGEDYLVLHIFRL